MFKRLREWLSILREWWTYFVVRGEKRVGQRGRAFTPRLVKKQPIITVTARKFNAEKNEWEDVPVTNVRVERI